MRSIEDLISSGELFIAYQPVVDLQTHRVFAYEALVRSTTKAYANPLVLIKAALEQNVMGLLGRYLRKLAVDGCPGYRLFLNIHPNEFSQAYLVRPDDSMIGHDREVYLEITESVPLSEYKHCFSVLAEMRTRGVKIAVDDLGAGFSNLKYIVDLQPEIVKLDRNLVMDLDKDKRLIQLVASLVNLCTDLGARVVAEGIETKDELMAVIDAGVHFGQGYYLQRPNPVISQTNWNELF